MSESLVNGRFLSAIITLFCGRARPHSKPCLGCLRLYYSQVMLPDYGRTVTAVDRHLRNVTRFRNSVAGIRVPQAIALPVHARGFTQRRDLLARVIEWANSTRLFGVGSQPSLEAVTDRDEPPGSVVVIASLGDLCGDPIQPD